MKGFGNPEIVPVQVLEHGRGETPSVDAAGGFIIGKEPGVEGVRLGVPRSDLILKVGELPLVSVEDLAEDELVERPCLRRVQGNDSFAAVLLQLAQDLRRTFNVEIEAVEKFEIE